jgi:hypothetical protein
LENKFNVTGGKKPLFSPNISRHGELNKAMKKEKKNKKFSAKKSHPCQGCQMVCFQKSQFG